VTPDENRFEQWFSKAPFGRLILILALAVAWLLCDSLLAFVIVETGNANPEDFFATSLHFHAHADHRDTPEIRQILSQHVHLYSSYLDRFQADGLLGTRLVPNFTVVESIRRSDGADSGNADGEPFWFMTDEYGFPLVARLGHHYSLRKPAGVFRVVMLGGSTVEGIGVNSPLDSLPSKLQLLMEREFAGTSRQAEVINGGISYFASDREYLRLIADLLRFEPDLVIAYDGWNDAQVLPENIAGDPRTRPYRTVTQQGNEDRLNASFSPGGSFGLFARLSSRRLLEWLTRFSTFRVLHYSINLMANAFHHPGSDAKHDPPDRPELSVEAAHVYMENRERMLFIARQEGFRFASFLQPIVGIDGKTYSATEARNAPPAGGVVSREREIFYQTVRPLLGVFSETNEQSGRYCVADISTRSFAGVSDTVYSDTGHLLANGNELVAQHILAELERCKLLPQ
jgi:hypothetical protein